MTPGNAALAYVAIGRPVFPGVAADGPRRKAPHTPRGYLDATTDTTIIIAWWTRWPDALIGMPTGRISGLSVLDVDVKRAEANGFDTLDDLGHSILPETPMVHTASGGLHVYFDAGARELRCSAGLLGPGLDIRGDGGYVILPSPGSGYSWDPQWNFGTVQLAPAPDWLWPPRVSRPAVAPPPIPTTGLSPYAEAAIEGACNAIVRAGPGEQERTLNAEVFSIGTLAGAGLVPAGIALRALMRAGNAMPDHDPGWPWRSEEIDLKVQRAFTAGQAQPREVFVRWLDDGDPEVATERERYRQQNPRQKEQSVSGQVKIRRGGEYQMRKISWLWPGWLARGKLHILGGMKGTGKSTIAFDLLAQITVGGKWPDGTRAPIGDVLPWSGEDDIEDTILPRIAAAGGDPDRVCFIDGIIVDGVKRAFDPGNDMAALLDTVRELPDLVAILIDPIVSATPGDSHKNSETRRGLQPLVDLADERNIAVIGITHFTKGTQGKDPIERITGSLAFGAIPRVVWGAAKGDSEDGPRRLVRIASNIGQTGGGFEYLLRQDLLPDHDFTAQRIVWGDRLVGSPLELLENSQEKSKKMQAIALLDTQLVNGPVLVGDIQGAAKANGISWTTIERAKREDKRIVAEQAGELRALGLLADDGSRSRGWYWRKKRDGLSHA